MSTDKIVLAGRPHPLGATPFPDGVNFSVFSQHATGVELLLFEAHDQENPSQVITLDPFSNRSFAFWHCFVEGLEPGAHYAYRIDGPFSVEEGHRFNRNKVLIDPYARGNTDALWNRIDACSMADNLPTSMRSVVIDISDYDWEGDEPLRHPMSETIIYEMHVGGFTRSLSAKVRHPGSFKAVIDKIPYLKDLGITAVELLPVFEFDDSNPLRVMADGQILTNFWGYSTLGFFAPEGSYCVTPEAGTHINEFRDMVKALHQADIEVILDVVFNHTDEGNHLGPTISFKGFDNSIYYHLVVDDKEYYLDYTGCGNTVNCNHPIMEKFIRECLEFWVNEMHVDGFRFDEGSILSRGEDGMPMQHPPVLWTIELSESLADTKLIAEAWDAAGLYQIGYFPGYRWAEWNGRYRDTIRRFVAGEPGIVGEFATRLAGSADLYQRSGRLPVNSINFITCHDGFTLNDLVSYNEKHNEANGENNRDGSDNNISWNCGIEGDTNDPTVDAFRTRQVKNFMAILLLSKGVPMILGGDEMRRTQQGNNNAYCHNNDISWYDWSRLDRYREVYRFVKKMIAFRKHHHILERRTFFGSETDHSAIPEVSWHGCQLNAPGWNDPQCRVLAVTLNGGSLKQDIHIIFNMEDADLIFELPSIAGCCWGKALDTGLPSPEDITEVGQEIPVASATLNVKARSIVVLVNK